jgi:hypothetical protein
MDSGMLPDPFSEARMVSDRHSATASRSANTFRYTVTAAAFCLIGVFAVSAFCPNLFAQRSIPFPPPIQPARPAEKVVLLKMRVEEARVTADITDTPLQHVLKELADRTGIVFEVRSQENPAVSIHLQRVPLPEAIQRIAGASNAIFYYGEGAESQRIIMVRIFSRTTPGPQPSLLYLGNGVIAKTNNTVETPEQALQVLASNSSIEDKEIGIELLAKSKSNAAVKALMDCISDPAPEIRAAAIDGLASMGSQAALPAILKSIKDEHPGVRQSAAMAVASLGNSGNLKDLRPLSFDKDARVAAAAEIAIRRLAAAEKK